MKNFFHVLTCPPEGRGGGEGEEEACKCLPAVMKTILTFCPLITHLHVSIYAMWGFISFSLRHLTLTILLWSVWTEEDKLQ